MDIGCGDGIHCRTLLEMGAKKVSGVDLSDEFIRLAREKDAEYADKIEYHVGNGGNMDMIADGSQDVLFSNMAIHVVLILNQYFMRFVVYYHPMVVLS